MFEFLYPKKKAGEPLKEVPKSDDKFLYSTQLSLTHSDGSTINIIIQGKKEKHISYISERISSLFKNGKDQYEKFNKDFDVQSNKFQEEFNKIFEQFIKGPK